MQNFALIVARLFQRMPNSAPNAEPNNLNNSSQYFFSEESRSNRHLWQLLLLILVLVGSVENSGAQTLDYVRSFEVGKSLKTPLNAPGAFAVVSPDVFYLTDLDFDRVLQSDNTGKISEVRGRFGWRKQEYDDPTDIVLAQNLDVYVADYYNQRLQHYDRNLNFIRTIPLVASDESVRYYPKSVDQSPDNRIYVLDAEQNQLLELNPQGNYLQSLATFSELGDDLANATRLRVNPNGDIWVLTSGAGNIYIFDRFGTFKKKIQYPAMENPVGIAFYSESLAFIADQDRQLYQIINGTVITPLTSVALPEASALTDVAIYRDRLYLLTENPVRIAVYQIKAPMENE